MGESLAADLGQPAPISKLKVPSWVSLRYGDIGQGHTNTANEIYNKFSGGAVSRKSLWKEVPVNYVQELVDNLGASVVAARHGAPDPNKKGGFNQGHVALVRALPSLDFGKSFNPSAGPYLNNIGETSNTKVLPASMSHGGNFRYFVNRYDPQVVRTGKTAAIETDPSFQGIRHTASKHLFNVVARARKETDPGFIGPRSASTNFLTDSLGWNPHAPASRDPLTASLTQINQNVIRHQRDVELLRQASRQFR